MDVAIKFKNITCEKYMTGNSKFKEHGERYNYKAEIDDGHSSGVFSNMALELILHAFPSADKSKVFYGGISCAVTRNSWKDYKTEHNVKCERFWNA